MNRSNRELRKMTTADNIEGKLTVSTIESEKSLKRIFSDPMMPTPDGKKSSPSFVVKKQPARRNKAHYDMALQNIDARELAQMDRALIGLSSELYRSTDQNCTVDNDAPPKRLLGLASSRRLLPKASFANIDVSDDGRVTASVTGSHNKSFYFTPNAASRPKKVARATTLTRIDDTDKGIEENDVSPRSRRTLKPPDKKFLLEQRRNTQSDIKYHDFPELPIRQRTPLSKPYRNRRRSKGNPVMAMSSPCLSPTHATLMDQDDKKSVNKQFSFEDDLSTFSQIKCDSLDISADGNVSSDNMSSSMESTVHSVGTSEECEIESLHSGACTPLFSQYEDDEDEESCCDDEYGTELPDFSSTKKQLSPFGSFRVGVSKVLEHLSPRPINSTRSADHIEKFLMRSNSGGSSFHSLQQRNDSFNDDEKISVVTSLTQIYNSVESDGDEDDNLSSTPNNNETSDFSGENSSPRTLPARGVYREKSGICTIYNSGPAENNLLVQMTDDERIMRAAMHIRDAMHERPIKQHRSGVLAVRFYSFQHSTFWVLFMRMLIIAQMSLVLIEPPSNRSTEDYPSSFSPYDCGDSAHLEIVDPQNCFRRLAQYPVTRTVCLLAETCIIVVYLVDISLTVYGFGWRDIVGLLPSGVTQMDSPAARKNRVWDQLRSISVLLMIIDLGLNWTVTNIRISRVFRPVLFVYKSRELRRWFYLIVSTLPKIVGLALLIFSFIAVYAIVGVLLFSDQSYYTGERYEYANFNSFGKASISLYVLMTSENYPYIMYPAFESDVGDGSHYYALFFVSFLLVVMFFLANLSVPYLFDSFKRSHLNEALSGRIVERMSLLASFQLVDIECKGFINFERFRSLVSHVRQDLFNSDGTEKRPGLISHMFDELCASHPGRCNPLDFFQISDVILTEFEVTDDRHRCLHAKFPWLSQATLSMEPFVNSPLMETGVLFLLLVNTIMLAFYHRDNSRNNEIIFISRVFIFIFAFEIVFKVVVLGFSKFRSSWKNVYDGIVVLVAFGFALREQIVVSHGPLYSNLASIFICIRALRLFPALGIFTKLNVIVKILPFMFFSMLTVALFMYIFAIIGMDLFSKRFVHNIHIEPYADLNIQFDNFAGSMMALFQVLVGNNWDEIMYTAMYSTNSVVLPALYFIFFHFIAVSLLLQLVIAIYVEAFETYSNNVKEASNKAPTISTPSMHDSNKLYESSSPNSEDKLSKLRSPDSSQVTPSPDGRFLPPRESSRQALLRLKSGTM
mmetsp:Transcript_19148/g.27567  ORF Transcript_19148/g.27567 Transcript_19148/m.27567 type:complete len:1247 (-) Transcript_19148:441-4181(-)